MTYTIGRLHDPRPEELERPFGSLELAREEARLLSRKLRREAIAVWNNHPEVEVVVIDGIFYRPE